MKLSPSFHLTPFGQGYSTNVSPFDFSNPHSPSFFEDWFDAIHKSSYEVQFHILIIVLVVDIYFFLGVV